MEVMISPVAVCCIILAVFMAGTVAGGDRDHEPQFTRPIGNLTAAVGREAVLACTVDHLGNHRVGWLRAEDQTVLSLHTSMVTHNPRITLTHDNYKSWQLHIRQVKETDKGCYMCQVNTKVMKKQIGCLDVHVPPDFLVGDTSGDMAVQEGDNATLICKATGNPQPRVTWKREDGQKVLQRKGLRDTVEVDVLAGEELHFWKVDRRQMGSYLCIASNDVPPAVSKRVYLAVNFAPVIKVPNQLLGAPLYTTVTLECHVEAFPNTINYWVKNRAEMLLNGSKYAVWENQTGYYKVVMWLSILTFRPTDIGTYNCISTNSLGKAEGTLRLYGLADTSASESSKSKSSTTVESSARDLQINQPFIILLLVTALLRHFNVPSKLS